MKLGASSKVVLVTGGTGNMGREAVRRLLDRSDVIVRLFVRPAEKDHPLVRAWCRNSRIEFAWGDLAEFDTIERAVKGADVILHMGGLVSPLADSLPPELVTRVNVGGAKNIVEAIKRVSDVERVRLVYIGTVAQTGSRNAPIHWGRTGDPIKISHYDHYAVTKTQAEAAIAESGLRYWVSLRQTGMAKRTSIRCVPPR